MRPLPTDSEAVEAIGILIGPLTGGTPFNPATDERAATVLLDYGTAKVLGQPPATALALPDFHAQLREAHATGNPSNVNWGQLLKLILTLLGGLAPVLGG